MKVIVATSGAKIDNAAGCELVVNTGCPSFLAAHLPKGSR